MNIQRQTFAALLTTLAPAIEAKGIVPQFCHYCFTGSHVYAYNDIVAIEAQCEFPALGGLHGDLLSKWVSKVKGREIEITQEGKSAVLLKCGRSRITLPLMNPAEFLFTKPEKVGKTLELPAEEFIACLKEVLPCANPEASAPWQFGVTVHFGEKVIECFATQTYNMARATIPNTGKVHVGTTLLMPPQFCELLVTHAISLTKITASEQWIVAHFEGVRVYAKLTATASIDKYHAVCRPELREAIKQRLVTVPKHFASALDRVMLVLDSEEETFMRLQIKDNLLIVTAVSEDGASNAKERLQLPGEHPPVVALVERAKKYMRPVLSNVTNMAILPEKKILAFGGDGVLYLFAIKRPPKEID